MSSEPRSTTAVRGASRRLGARARWLFMLAAGFVLLAAVMVVQGNAAAAAASLAAAQLVVLVVLAARVRRLAALTSRGLAHLEGRAGEGGAGATRGQGRFGSAVGASNDSASARAWRNHPSAGELLATGIFDADFYALTANRSFTRVEDAASHFLARGMARLASPHPLVHVKSLPDFVMDLWRAGDIDGVLAHLRADPTALEPLGPLFDPRLLPASTAEAGAGHPGGCLGRFLEQATDSTPLPAPGRTALWGDVRKATDGYLTSFGRGRRLRRPRTTTKWDAKAEARWRSEVSAMDVPAAAGGQPLVSVIMPAWNRETKVVAAIRSVQAQTLDAWELIVVDDGSDDDTLGVVRALAAGDDRVRPLERPHGGVCAARNAGLAVARGEFVAFLDTDNEWEPDFLELMVKGLQHAGAGAAYSGIELRTGESTSYRAYDGGLDDLLVKNHIDLNVLVLRSSLLKEVGGFDESLRRWVDHDLAIRVARRETPVLFPFIGCRYDHEDEGGTRITTTESENWQFVVLGNNLVDWAQLERQRGGEVPGRCSVVMPAYQDHVMTTEAVDSILRSPGDVEVIVIDNGSSLETGTALAQLWASEPRVRLIHLARNLNFAIGSNIGAAEATGEYVFFLNNDTVAPENALAPLLERLQDRECLGVQPLLLYPDNSVQAAGTVFVADNHLPVHFLAGMPPEDAQVTRHLRFRAVTAAALLMRRADVVRLRGFDPLFVNGMEDVDLCLRATADNPHGSFAVVPSVSFQHLESKTPGRGLHLDENRRLFIERWRGRLPAPERDKLGVAGLRAERFVTDGRVVPGLRPVWVRDRPRARLRWGLRYAAIGGSKGDRWGDTSFAESLAAALRRQGQEVVTYRHGANRETAQVFDDVSLVLRGLDLVPPIPGIINLLWVISHPELVTPVEVRGFDLAFAASTSWSNAWTKRSGREVRPLLQATDPDRFAPLEGHEQFTRPAVFVGGHYSRRERRVVVDALAAGVDLRIIGSGWDGVVPDGIHESDHVDNQELSGVYRTASRVLADHWPEMAEQGFLQNRLFDAVASGARVISDDVVDLREVFGSAVQTYDGLPDLRHLCSPEGALRFGTRDEILEQAEVIRTRHSFDARARTLVEAVESMRSSP